MKNTSRTRKGCGAISSQDLAASSPRPPWEDLCYRDRGGDGDLGGGGGGGDLGGGDGAPPWEDHCYGDHHRHHHRLLLLRLLFTVTGVRASDSVHDMVRSNI